LIFFALWFSIVLLSGTAYVLAGEGTFRNTLGMSFVLIPKGSFWMGSPQGEPHRDADEALHHVEISESFYLQTTEVTLGQWREVMGTRFFGRRKAPENTPVVRISWHDCREFIKALNTRGEGRYRLPTEAEWEYACRAGTRTPYPWGDRIACDKAMYSNNRLKSERCVKYVQSAGLTVGRPAPVGRYQANAWGLYDMPGNVWEWCMDWYGDYEKGPLTDPRGPADGIHRVRRGGSWFGHGHLCRSANRNFGHPGDRYRTAGFRLVRETD
jgi:formylglycine-generating enzyme required for sulfatase activity